MKLLMLSAAFACLATASVRGEETPFAQQPLARPGQSSDASLLSLGDVMGITQLRHIKLWYAAKSSNWDLVTYETDKIKESLFKAAVLYVNIPVELVTQVDPPLKGMREAAARKDFAGFSRSYFELTAACNMCHVAGNVGFIRIQTPNSSPFSDQAYVNEKK